MEENFTYHLLGANGNDFGVTVIRKADETKEEFQKRGYIESLRKFAYYPQLPLFLESPLEQVRKTLREKFEQGKIEKIVEAHIEIYKEIDEKGFVWFSDKKRDPLNDILDPLFTTPY